MSIKDKKNKRLDTSGFLPPKRPDNYEEVEEEISKLILNAPKNSQSPKDTVSELFDSLQQSKKTPVLEVKGERTQPPSENTPPTTWFKQFKTEKPALFYLTAGLLVVTAVLASYSSRQLGSNSKPQIHVIPSETPTTKNAFPQPTPSVAPSTSPRVFDRVQKPAPPPRPAMPTGGHPSPLATKNVRIFQPSHQRDNNNDSHRFDEPAPANDLHHEDPDAEPGQPRDADMNPDDSENPLEKRLNKRTKPRNRVTVPGDEPDSDFKFQPAEPEEGAMDKEDGKPHPKGEDAEPYYEEENSNN